ncbi:L-serine ammonia-lyase, iron-sulfur-dependent, subunit alpha [Schaalia sp. 19OD2882]|uniref:L-serine ammonia-lyase, iron-sulfur-dependent, subunit alpha n=1 Tax=Schaalia sp. 19OD2882 TaxID=2794089 RepID=UPI001C1EB56B|nr:L-serine ammonia-lyase, iron-sulfur-dependent, subunit alpha [Schaalia sp. 19OD2882]QWW19676.1 L-serine ammonia-lyase, iron-sulfur-dependent, subunit alpha [Schaalia sp. 19OD2882]
MTLHPTPAAGAIPTAAPSGLAHDLGTSGHTQLSVVDLFRVGIGPSSSHTVGPMRAGRAFAGELSILLHTDESLPGLGRTQGVRVLGSGPAPVRRLTIELFGSLGATGRGHSTDRAVLLGLAGLDPETVSIDQVEGLLPTIADSGHLNLARIGQVPFDLAADLRFLPRTVLPHHVNALTITAWGSGGIDAGEPLLRRTYYSVGGGFLVVDLSPDPARPVPVPLDRFVPGSWDEGEAAAVSGRIASRSAGSQAGPKGAHRGRAAESSGACGVCATPGGMSGSVPHPFRTGRELLKACADSGLSVADLVRANEEALRPPSQVEEHLDLVANTMFECVDAGIAAHGILPGGLDVPRRAAALAAKLQQRATSSPEAGTGALEWASTPADPMRAMDWVNLYALAVNEENAAGHRVVTAPTNGAAGVVPAVLGYLTSYCPEAGAAFGIVSPSDQTSTIAFRISPEDTDEAPARRRRAVHDFLLAATAVGSLIKTNASIAGAEVGCQGEVGSASAMAAAGLAQALGGTPSQVENAAEIAMEHSLGLTCDPVAGLVQIPCIERNAIAAVKAINAARMALWGDGRHAVSLDAVIETMRQTGVDMLSKYKETSAGGLAVNVIEC